MTISREQQQLIVSARAAASAYPVWKRWLPLWHGFFYVTLMLTTVVFLIGVSHSWWQYVAILSLSLLLAIWYSFCMTIDPLYWQQHALITMGYFAIGWICWLGLIILFPIYLFLLFGLYPQVFTFPRMPWKLIAASILTLLSFWGQVLAWKGLNWTFIIALGTGVSGILLGLFIDAIVKQSQERQYLIRELEVTRQELAATERQAGVIEERQRLAREIHDTLAQGFTSIIMHLEAIEGIPASDVEGVQRHLAQVQRTARANLAEARRVMWALQPEAFDQASLPEVLTTLAERWTEEGTITVRATITGTSRFLRPEIEVTLLRTAQEAFANIQKYARANQVTITLSYMDDVVVLDVQDDGKGFDPTSMLTPPFRQTSGGFGLKALRKRVEQLEGTLSIESTPGEGTTLAVALPALSNESLPASLQVKTPKEIRP